MTSFAEVMTYIGYVLLAILVLLVMITVHELGHYIAGKIFKFGIEEFAIGFGPKIFKKTKKNGEVFSIRLFPLGGFCSFSGEDKDSTDPKAFNNKKPWQRIIVLISGALMNYLFAVLIICITFGAYGQSSIMAYEIDKGQGYQAEYSFSPKDVILKCQGKNIYLTPDLMGELEGKKQGEEVKFTVLRNGENKDIVIKLRADANFKSVEDNQTLFKVLGTYSYSNEKLVGGLRSTYVRFSFFQTIGRSFEYSVKLAGTIFTVLGQLLTGRIGIGSMGGTITTIGMTANAVRTGGLWYLLYITSYIGVNLAVFNLLPIPALDGSRVIFTTIEWIRKKPINRKVESIIHAVGLVLLLAFAVFIDLQQCF